MTKTFSARVISGRARGRTLGVPTLNLDLRDVPADLQDGVFAARVTVDGKTYPASMHVGPRPTFGDTRSCEAHLIDHVLPSAPETVTVEPVEWLRGIEKFASAEALTEQMHADIRRSKDILGT